MLSITYIIQHIFGTSLKEWKKMCSGMGLPLNDMDMFFTLCFTDNQVLITQDAYDADRDLEVSARISMVVA